MSNFNDLIEISGCDNSSRRGDVIFVHGLGGTARGTWHPQEKQDDDNFWCAWLGEDLPDVGIWSLGYEVEPFRWKGNSMPLADRATNSLDLLDSYEIGDRPIIFITHSMGGLLVKQTIADWLVAELNSKYQVPKQIGQDWVEKQELLPLLDGLDKVNAERRDSCVAALNNFNQNYAPEMVVCSRIKDYSALSNRLNFQSAIYLKSLTQEQIVHYLDSIKADLTGLRALIEEDTALQELATSPLMLNIMVLAYEGVAIEDLPKTEVVGISSSIACCWNTSLKWNLNAKPPPDKVIGGEGGFC